MIFTREQFWPSGIDVACVCLCLSVSVGVCQRRACPRDSSSLVQAGITKIGPEVQNNMVKVPIILVGH